MGNNVKPVVYYNPVEWALPPVVGGRADVIPVNHPKEGLNGAWATTSRIISVDADCPDDFETKNSVYKMVK